MKKRQLKKLCKKSAELLCSNNSIDGKYAKEAIGVHEELEIFVLWYQCCYEVEEYDYVNTWKYLVDQFFYAFFDYDEERKNPYHAGPKPTPRNVFRWARLNKEKSLCK